MNKALSPLDGRYVEKVGELARFFSESALIRSRIAVEVEWLIFLTNTLKLKGTERLNPAEAEALRKLYTDFRDEFADEVKEIEKTTNHDVKAVEYFLQKALEVLKRGDLISFVHFGCTSEDINNLAYAQMLKGGVQTVLMVNLEKVLAYLKEMAETYRKIPMMSRTHGQAASPTTVGKEFKNVGARLFRQYEQLSKAQYLGKLNGATGNFNAHSVAYPEVDWITASRLATLHHPNRAARLHGGNFRQSTTYQHDTHRFLPRYMDLHFTRLLHATSGERRGGLLDHAAQSEPHRF